MEGFLWRPGIGDPSIGGWLTVGLYFIAAVSSWRTSRVIGRAARIYREPFAWRAIAILFLVLGINKQLDLQSALTEFGRFLARQHGFYEQRREVQLLFVIGVAVVCLIAAVALVIAAWEAPMSTWIAMAGAVIVLCFVLVRAASFHHVDSFISQRFFGLRWNWILEMGGIMATLLASWSRR